MPRRQVLFVTPWYPTADHPSSGVFVREHARAAAINNDVTVLHLAGRAEPGVGQAGLLRVTDEEITAGIATWRLYHRGSPLIRSDVVAQTIALHRAIARLRRRGEADPALIHAHVFLAGFPAVIAGKLRRIPVVVSEHYSAFPLRSLASHDVLKARIAFRLADRVLPVSNFLRKAIEGHGIHARFQVVPNVVDTTVFFPPSRLRDASLETFLYVGHLYEDKGIGDLLTALGDVHLRSKEWRLVVIGDGSQQQWRDYASQMRIAERVSFLGPVPKPQVGEWMRQSDALVIPSWVETQSVVLLEAIACELPVLATRLKAIDEIWISDAGIRFAPRAPSELAEVLLSVLDRKLRFPIDAFANNVREQFGPKHVGDVLNSLYAEVET